MKITDAQQDVERILFSEKEIRARVRALGKELTERYRDKNPIVVCILKGACLFFTDLVRAMDCNLTLDFLAVSSYGNSTASAGTVRFIKDLEQDIADRHVIIVEDIVDSGLTLQHLKKVLSARNPASITTVALLDKPAHHAPDLNSDYIGFEIEDAFVVGYGLDYAQVYRNLPYIGILKPEVYT